MLLQLSHRFSTWLLTFWERQCACSPSWWPVASTRCTGRCSRSFARFFLTSIQRWSCPTTRRLCGKLSLMFSLRWDCWGVGKHCCLKTAVTQPWHEESSCQGWVTAVCALKYCKRQDTFIIPTLLDPTAVTQPWHEDYSWTRSLIFSLLFTASITQKRSSPRLNPSLGWRPTFDQGHKSCRTKSRLLYANILPCPSSSRVTSATKWWTSKSRWRNWQATALPTLRKGWTGFTTILWIIGWG